MSCVSIGQGSQSRKLPVSPQGPALPKLLHAYQWEECGKKHNRLLHGSTSFICNVVVRNRAMPPSKSPNFTAPTQAELEAANDTQNALLPIQQVLVEGSSKSCNVFFDSGSNTNLVRHAYAQELGLPGAPVTQHLQVTGKQPEQWDTFAYRVPLCKTNREIQHVLAFGIEDITADLPPVNLAPVVTLFSGVKLKDIQ